MKEVYSYQEIQPLTTKGQAISFTCHVHAELTTIQKQPGSDTVTATIHILVGEVRRFGAHGILPGGERG